MSAEKHAVALSNKEAAKLRILLKVRISLGCLRCLREFYMLDLSLCVRTSSLNVLLLD